MKNYISPSLICMDLCNLNSEISQFEKLGCELLHVDIIDGKFSPDMPIGVEAVKQLRKKTDMRFDVHLMAVDNKPYIDLLLECGIEKLCFHTEYEQRPTILIRKIKAAGVKAGIAISPETPICELEHILPLCDFVLVMRIDAGYAHLPGQSVYDFTDEKILKLRKKYPHLEITVDGRVGFDDIKPLRDLGANVFVSGTKGVFSKDNTREENWNRLNDLLEEK